MKQDPEGPKTIRLNRYIANAGICNRREADELIKKGEIQLNGEVVKGMGIQIQPGKDRVTYQGRSVRADVMRYVLMNKPAGYVVHGKGGKSIYALMRDACEERLYPVNPLSLDDVGLQLFTNDRDLSERLMEKGAKEASLYHVLCSKAVSEEQLERLRKGIKVGKRGFQCSEALISEGSEGKGIGLRPVSDDLRLLKEALKAARLPVDKIDRITYAGLNKKNLSRGKWRMLSAKEVGFLQMASR